MIGTIAVGLRSAGIGPGSGVAMDLDVSAESLAAYLAGYTLGCPVIGVHPVIRPPSGGTCCPAAWTWC